MKPEIKLYYVIPLVFLVILIVIVLLIPSNKQPVKKTDNTGLQPTMPFPTQIIIDKTPPVPTIATTFTGAIKEQNIPKEQVDLAAQKKELRKKIPLKQDTFTVTFDFTSDKFIVTLNDPKDTNRTIFEDWLKTNYPGLPLDRFMFK